MQSSRHGWPRLPNVVALTLALGSTATGTVLAAQPAAEATVARTPEAVDRRIIVFVRSPGDEGTFARLRLELREGDWRILEVRADELESRSLASVAEREGATAAVRIDAARAEASLWVRGPESAVLETFAPKGDRASDYVLALRIAESLRARGLFLPAARDRTGANSGAAEPPAAPDETEPSVEPRRPTEQTRVPISPKPDEPAEPAPVVDALGSESESTSATRIAVELGPGLALSPGGLGPLAVAGLGLHVELRRWSLCLLGTYPLSQQSTRGDEGQADVSSAVAGALLEFEWARWRSAAFRTGLGGGVSTTWMSGTASSGYRATDDTVLVPTPLLRTSLHWSLRDWLRLRAALLAGVTVPKVAIEFGSREVASWGQPFAVATLGVELHSR